MFVFELSACEFKPSAVTETETTFTLLITLITGDYLKLSKSFLYQKIVHLPLYTYHLHLMTINTDNLYLHLKVF